MHHNTATSLSSDAELWRRVTTTRRRRREQARHGFKRQVVRRHGNLSTVRFWWANEAAQCWLGFALGMGCTFGGVIPTVVGGIIAGLSVLIHRQLKPAVVRGWAALEGD